MTTRRLVLFLSAVLGMNGGRSIAAEIGDLNDDGRVSFADAFLAARWFETGLDLFSPALGSDDFATTFHCFPTLSPEFIFMEALRRSSPAALPHFIDEWPGPGADTSPPPDPDDSVRLEVLPIRHAGGDGRVDLQVKLTSELPLDFVAILLSCEGLDLRPEPPPLTSGMSGSSEYYLQSGGLLAFHSTLWYSRTLDAERTLVLPCALPLGAEPGRYRVQLLPATEAVTSFGSVVRPVLAESTLELAQTITSGHRLPFPPLDFTRAGERRIGGTAEVRFTDAEGLPGEDVTFKLQVRTERPIGRIEFDMRFDPSAILVKEARPLYVDAELGRVVPGDHRALFLNTSRCTEDGGYFAYRYTPSPVDTGLYSQTGEQPHLKYLAPLGEWIDLLEVQVEILPAARGRGAVPLEFIDRPTFDGDLACYFQPYFQQGTGWHGCHDSLAYWQYETTWTPGHVNILGGGDAPPPLEPPIDPEAAGIEITIGNSLPADPDQTPEPVEVKVARGEVAELPVYFRSAVPIWKVLLSLGYDTALLDLVALDVYFLDFDGRPFTVRLLPRDEEHKTAQNALWSIGPDGKNQVLIGLLPYSAELFGEPWETVPEGVLLADIATVYCWNVSHLGGLKSWDTGKTHQLGAAYFRAREDAPPGRTEIVDRQVEWQPFSFKNTQFFLTSQTQGYPMLVEERPARLDVPASLVRRGVIVISDNDTSFLRGDSNQDDRFNLSDASSTLNSLFLGGDGFQCEDAADANDDGELNIADAIYSLAHLFLGGLAPPLPFPVKGTDPTEDQLGCVGAEP